MNSFVAYADGVRVADYVYFCGVGGCLGEEGGEEFCYFVGGVDGEAVLEGLLGMWMLVTGGVSIFIFLVEETYAKARHENRNDILSRVGAAHDGGIWYMWRVVDCIVSDSREAHAASDSEPR